MVAIAVRQVIAKATLVVLFVVMTVPPDLSCLVAKSPWLGPLQPALTLGDAYYDIGKDIDGYCTPLRDWF